MNISEKSFLLDSLALPVVTIIGPPGSGKTEVGRQLAQDLSWTFWDTDKLIEQATNLTVPGIFERYGEQMLRILEQKLVKQISHLYDIATRCQTDNDCASSAGKQGTIISTGGGLPVSAENFAELARIGRLISLQATIDVLADRATRQGNRPLLYAQDNGQSQKSRLELLVKERRDVYLRAEWSIDTSNLNVAAVAQCIKEKLGINLL